MPARIRGGLLGCGGFSDALNVKKHLTTCGSGPVLQDEEEKTPSLDKQ